MFPSSSVSSAYAPQENPMARIIKFIKLQDIVLGLFSSKWGNDVIEIFGLSRSKSSFVSYQCPIDRNALLGILETSGKFTKEKVSETITYLETLQSVYPDAITNEQLQQFKDYQNSYCAPAPKKPAEPVSVFPAAVSHVHSQLDPRRPAGQVAAVAHASVLPFFSAQIAPSMIPVAAAPARVIAEISIAKKDSTFAELQALLWAIFAGPKGYDLATMLGVDYFQVQMGRNSLLNHLKENNIFTPSNVLKAHYGLKILGTGVVAQKTLDLFQAYHNAFCQQPIQPVIPPAIQPVNNAPAKRPAPNDNASDNSSNDCPICLDKRVEATALNCGHVFCKACIAPYPVCQACNAPITQRIKLFQM